MGLATIAENEARYLRDSEPQSATHVMHSPARIGFDRVHGIHPGCHVGTTEISISHCFIEGDVLGEFRLNRQGFLPALLKIPVRPWQGLPGFRHLEYLFRSRRWIEEEF